ncbi:hypothetical protein EJ04DRAFT_526653 [Polyplosphaeria fusca]|uniref:Uncharacterized protein n=1 Tax=Polyplosphaeria fusca TaxID=682080 RepID=A0A9P4QTS6_9PLEO|nr:hypothetical protein EJ04DRAFT_526653 [Polyplosphaeria fusca]
MDKRQALKHYPADYTKHRDDLLQSEHNRGLSASDKTVWTVWDTTIKKTEQRHADLRPDLLLAFLARFGGGGVQEELLRLASLGISVTARKVCDGITELPEWLAKALTSNGEWEDFYYRQSRDILVRYSLLQQTRGDWDGVGMHGLVQWRAAKFGEFALWIAGTSPY